MMRSQTTNFRNPAAQFFLGTIALALVTSTFFRHGVDLASTAFAYLVVILLCSLMGSFTSSALLAVMSIAGLAYFFAPPVFSLGVDDPQHLIVVVTFFLTSLIVTRLMRNAHERMQAALQAEADLRHSDAVLRDSEKEWREVFEHNPLMYFKVDATGTVISVNTFGVAQLGYSATELAGQSVLDVFLEEDRELVRNYVAVCLETIGQSHTWEVRKVRKDGSVLWVRENAKAMRRADNKPILLIACEDITERKQAESALRQSEAYLAEAQNLSQTGSWAWDVRRKDFVYRSAQVYRLFGLDPKMGPVSLQSFQDRIFPDDLCRLVELEGRVVREKTHVEADFRIALPDGSIKRVHSVGHPVVGSDGEVVEIIGTHMDVTEPYAAKEALQKAFDALRESEERFRDYAETASDWLWETGPDHRITRISEHVNRHGITGSSMRNLAPWEYAADVETEPEKWRRYREMIDARVPFRDFVYCAPSGTGSAVYIQASGKPFFDAHGNFLGYRGVATDITATIRADHAEEALRKAQAELAHITRVTTLGELTASIAHETNQPLAAVVANAEACLRWLEGGTPDLDAARRSVEWIIEDGNRASEVIGRVKALAKKTDIEKVPLDINDAVRESIALLQRELTSHRVLLRTELAPVLPILGDRVQLQQ
jgi:PAS domain S-box-containing protein